MIKIISGATKMAPSMNIGHKAKELLLGPPLADAILQCTRLDQSSISSMTEGSPNSNKNIQAQHLSSLCTLSLQLLDYGGRL